MSDQLLFILKLCLLALLYLFFFRVLRAVWAEIKAPAVPTPAGAIPAPPTRRAGRKEASSSAAPAAPQLVALDPPDLRGRSFPLSEEVTLGRAAGCQITLDDTYISQLHARVYARDGRWLVEDLGSTNGTYLNRQRVSGPMVMHAGDRLQVGNTVLELR